jgi:hypothetical protein
MKHIAISTGLACQLWCEGHFERGSIEENRAFERQITHHHVTPSPNHRGSESFL